MREYLEDVAPGILDGEEGAEAGGVWGRGDGEQVGGGQGLQAVQHLGPGAGVNMGVYNTPAVYKVYISLD